MNNHKKVPVWLLRQMQRRLDSGGDMRMIQRFARSVSLRSCRAQGDTSTAASALAVGSNVVPFPLQSTLLVAPAGREAC